MSFAALGSSLREKLGKFLRKEREKRGRSRSWCASKTGLGCDRWYWRNIELGLRATPLSSKEAYGVARALSFRGGVPNRELQEELVRQIGAIQGWPTGVVPPGFASEGEELERRETVDGRSEAAS